MECNWLGHAMHSEVAENITALRTGSLDASALERDLRKSVHVKKFRAAQMIVPFLDSCIDASHVDLRRDRRILGMVPVDDDFVIELRELAVGSAERPTHTEPERSAG